MSIGVTTLLGSVAIATYSSHPCQMGSEGVSQRPLDTAARAESVEVNRLCIHNLDIRTRAHFTNTHRLPKISTCISTYTHCSIWDAITHPCPNFNGGLFKPPLKFVHGWVIASHWIPEYQAWKLFSFRNSFKISKKISLPTNRFLVTSPSTMIIFKPWSYNRIQNPNKFTPKSLHSSIKTIIWIVPALQNKPRE